MRALLIDADADDGLALARTLTAEGIRCETAELGEDGIQLAEQYDFDVILLDPTVCDDEGTGVLRRLRTAGTEAPIVAILTAATVDKTLQAFAMGADDCVARSRDARELVARIRALVRRAKGHADARISIGSLSIDVSACTVEADGDPLHLTAKEYQLLELLTLRRGKMVSRESISDHLYGGMRGPESKVIDVFVCNLRKKLASACRGQQFIHCDRGRGYVLRSPSSTQPYRPRSTSAEARVVA
jgi:two-component system cell cycle response regulator CtrA